MDTYLIDKISKIKFKITVFQDVTPGRCVDINPKSEESKFLKYLVYTYQTT